MCSAVPLYPLQKARHCETSANAGRGNPSSLPPGDRKGRPCAPTFHFSLFHPSHAKTLRKPRLPEGILMPNFNFSLKRHATDQRHQA